MKKSVIITMIIIFLIFSSSVIHAQGYFPFWQSSYFTGQYTQPWGFQQYTPGYFSLFNPFSQYGSTYNGYANPPYRMASGLWSWDSDSPWVNSEPQPYISSYTLNSLNPFNHYIPNYSSSYPLGSYGPPQPNNFSYAQPPGSPFLNLPPLPGNYYYPIGGRPLVPYYSLDEPLYGHDNTKNPYASDALWNLNWNLEDTDITLEMPDDGDSITVDIGETIGFILPNHADNYDADVEWVLDEDELDESIVEKISDERFPGYWYNNGGLRPTFKDGVEQWVFKAIGLGKTAIKLDCINREDDNTGTIEIEVIVTD